MTILMDSVFISEIVMQAKIAKQAGEYLNSTANHSDRLEIWGSIQSILIAAGNVSKILWPSEKSYSSRGVRLRTTLNIDDGHLLSDRTFRNHFEHYDSRIEEWFQKSPSAVYVDKGIGPFKSVWGNIPVNRHRFYDPQTKILTFRGESVNLGAVLDALEEIRHKCRHFVLT